MVVDPLGLDYKEQKDLGSCLIWADSYRLFEEVNATVKEAQTTAAKKVCLFSSHYRAVEEVPAVLETVMDGWM